MKKICLTVVGLYLGLLSAFSQTAPKDTTYKKRKLSVEEVNLVSSYYKQNGDHAAVTGGTGSQELSDIANTIDVKLVKRDSKNRKHTFDLELGVDRFTSASTDKIDPKTISSASSSDIRVYPSVNWSSENEQKGKTIGAGISLSNEYDYLSLGGNISYAKKTADKNGEFSIKATAYIDRVKLVLPEELRNTGITFEQDSDNNGYAPRNTYSTSLSWSQIINQRLQVMFMLDLVYQKGYLGLPFYRVYFDDNSLHIENLPGSRFKIPVGFRANYFLGDELVIRSYYRYYRDDWGLDAHTMNLETSVKLTPFFSISPFYRFYIQQGAKYFAPYREHTAAEQYYSSNYDLSSFNSHFFGAGLRITPPKGIFHIPQFNMIELRYGHYRRTDHLSADIVSLNLRFRK